MEQLRPLIKFLKEHGFWVACGLVVVVSLASWFVASGDLKTKAQHNKTSLKQRFQAGQMVSSKTTHPNEASDAAIDELIKARQAKVYQAWLEQESHQRGVLNWPRRLEEEHKDDFAAVVEMRPIEKLKSPNLSKRFRTTYREYVFDLLPGLADDIGAEWNPGGGQRLGEAQASTTSRAYVVDWKSQNQAELISQHFDWSNEPDKTPSTVQLLYAQEDIWVLEALMKIIQQTNGQVLTRREAAIKTIFFIKLGRNVSGLTGNITTLAQKFTEGDEHSGGASNKNFQEGQGRENKPAEDPAENRYVDLQYRPLSAIKLQQAFGTGQNAEAARLAVAKRMPVQLQILIGQDKIDKFMIECGNSKLPLEIRQVRVNPDEQVPDAAKPNRGVAGHVLGGAKQEIKDEKETDVTLEVYGIVSIYNPPDKEMLKILPDSSTTASTP